MDDEIMAMNSETDHLQKDMDLMQERFKKINIINDQVTGWARRVFLKFGNLVDSQVFAKGTSDIVHVFEGMAEVVC